MVQHLYLLVLLFVYVYFAESSPLDLQQSVIVTTTDPPKFKKNNDLSNSPLKVPKIYQMHINAVVSNRYANTTITSKVKNAANQSQEATFSIILPETAFISGFTMEVDGKNYTAYVKDKDEAKKTYDEASASGIGAAHIATSARDSNRFTVSVNVEPETKAVFYLVYEELLKRDDGHYEMVINLHPGQPIEDLMVEVVINESRKITDLKAPPIRSGNEIGNDKSELDPRANLEIVNNTMAVVRFTPTLERQKQLAHLLDSNENEGLAGQFVVQYDVERDPRGGEVLVQDGYFVHFFAPTEIPPLPKYVVFVLDTSYSMVGEKITQLKEAMAKILGELKKEDLFSLVEFNTNVKVWDMNNSNNSVWFPTNNEDSWRDGEVDEDLSNYSFPSAYAANAGTIEKAKTTVKELEPNGGTDIHNALSVGLHLVEMARKQNETDKLQSIIVFLTDGDPTIGLTEPEEIIDKISEVNSYSRKSPIFALSFGDGADKNFLRKLSFHNAGFSRHIYEASDASLQLQDFYRQISSPLLSNVTFKYEPSATSLTKTNFPVHFGGSELVVAGWCGTENLNPEVEGWGVYGDVHFVPTINKAISSVERLWAYLTLKQLLEKRENETENALEIALKYSFVTPISSLVVVKPNDTKSINTETAEKGGRFIPFAESLAAPAGYPLSGANIALKLADIDFPDRSGYLFTIESLEEPAQLELDYYEESVATTTKSMDLVNDLPWIQDILNDNQTLNLPTGVFKLGLNETLTDVVDCPKTPLNQKGHCTLLNYCPQIGSIVTTVKIFIKHFCVLREEFAGICCPTSL